VLQIDDVPFATTARDKRYLQPDVARTLREDCAARPPSSEHRASVALHDPQSGNNLLSGSWWARHVVMIGVRDSRGHRRNFLIGDRRQDV
jgi:hypothetical protein